MALTKEIELANGVIVSYHRIAALSIFTNEQNVIEVRSYTSRDKRALEAACIATGEWDDFVALVESQYYTLDYDQGMTVADAYEYLKGLPEFEGAQDDWATESIPSADQQDDELREEEK